MEAPSLSKNNMSSALFRFSTRRVGPVATRSFARPAHPKPDVDVNPLNEILLATGLGIVGGLIWKNYADGQKKTINKWYAGWEKGRPERAKEEAEIKASIRAKVDEYNAQFEVEEAL
jgi:hypothetical protein